MLTTAVPFDEAADFLQGKPPVTRAVFDKLLPELQARAFVITGVEVADALQMARDAIADIPRGADWDAQKKAITEGLEPYLGEGAEKRTEMLMRWHAYQAYSVGNLEMLEAQSDLFPYRQYMSAQDGRVRESHAALNGIVLPADSPFWERHTPPWEYGCRCMVRGITAEEANEIRQEDAHKSEEKQRVLDGPIKDELEQYGRLQRGVNEIYDVRTPSERGTTGPEWSSKDLRIPIEALEDRYDPEVWEKFRAWAEATEVPEVGTIWEWIGGEPSTSVAAVAGAAVQAAATIGKIGKVATVAKELAQHRIDYPAISTVFSGSRSPVAAPVMDALSAIDTVHGAPSGLPRCPIKTIPESRVMKGSLGEFASEAKEAPDGTLYDWRPRWLGLAPRAQDKELIAAHEIGHYLARFGFGSGPDQVTTDYRDPSTPIGKWWQEVSTTPTMQSILGSRVYSTETKLYLLSPHEAWARSYAQYIAVRSEGKIGDKMKLQLDLTREGSRRLMQWSDDEFAPVAQAIDRIFEGLGWLRPK